MFKRGSLSQTYSAQYLKPWVNGTTTSYTKTIGVANAASTIGSSILYNWYDPARFTYFGGAMVGSSGTSQNYAFNSTEQSASDRTLGQFVEFDFSGSVFEVAQQVLGANASASMIVFVNGIKQTQFAEVTATTNTTNDVFLIKFDFGTAVSRKITLYIDHGFRGIYSTVAPTASTRARNGKVMVVLSDSWAAGANSGAITHNFPLELALLTGHDEVVVLSQSGTGWKNDSLNTNGYGTARSPFGSHHRLTPLMQHKPSTILFAGSVNDVSIPGYDTTTNLDVTSAINRLLPNLPITTQVFIAGGQYVNLYTKPSYTPLDSQIGIGIANSAYPNRIKQIICTDTNTTSGTPWLTGTGTTAATAGDGNSDIYVTSDKKHLVAAGQYFWASQLANRMISFGV